MLPDIEGGPSAIDGARDAWATQEPDFQRHVVCLLGLPFDVITLDAAVAQVRDKAFSNKRCVVATPNINFVIAARTDPLFRGSVLHSDLSLVDGMPLVWLARLLRLPLPMRVSGADLFDALAGHALPVLRVYFFGGPRGAAAAACERLNRHGGGLRCVGFDSAGEGTVEALSSDAHIDRINRSGAHFLVVALGAKKGQAWIEHNASRLAVPVISHLGAVINFMAGSVQRAPRWMQQSGLEWLWRIRQEPGLSRRYWNDGIAAGRLLVTHVIPDALSRRRYRPSKDTASMAEPDDGSGRLVLSLEGAWRGSPEALRSALTRHAESQRQMTIDLAAVTDVGDELLGLLALARGWFESRGGLAIVNAPAKIARVFDDRLVDYLLR